MNTHQHVVLLSSSSSSSISSSTNMPNERVCDRRKYATTNLETTSEAKRHNMVMSKNEESMGLLWRPRYFQHFRQIVFRRGKL